MSFDSFEKQFDRKFDFNFFIPYSLGCSELLHNKINEIYSLNKETYHQAYKNSTYFNDDKILSLSVLNQVSTQRLIGILSVVEPLEKEKIILKLIKISFKFIYQYVRRVRSVDIYEIRDISLDYAKKKKLSKIYGSAHVFFITLYLCKVFDKKINLEDNMSSVNLVESSIENIHVTYSFESIGIQNEEDFIKQFKAQYSNFPLKKFDSLSLNHFITNLNHSYKMDRKDTVKTNEQLNELANKHDFVKGLTIVAVYLGINKINFIDLQNITPIEDSSVNDILNYIHFTQEGKDEKITTGYLLGALSMLNALIMDYKKVKNELLNTSIEDALLEAKNIRELYGSKLNSLQAIERDLIYINSSQKNTIEFQQQEMNNLRKSNELLSERLSKLEEQNFVLNNIVTDIQDISYTSSSSPINQQMMIEFLSRKKIIVIGGDPKWISQLINTLPNLDNISPDDLNRDLKYISNYEAVFFNYKVNNHSMFNKIKKSLKNSETLLYYCGEFSNIEKNIYYFYSRLQSD